MKDLEIPKTYTIKNTPKEILAKWYTLMTLGRAIDNKAPNYLKQAIGWSYHAPYAGHDGIQLAIGQVFEKNNDHLFPYYRDMLTALSAGMTGEAIIMNEISKLFPSEVRANHRLVKVMFMELLPEPIKKNCR